MTSIYQEIETALDGAQSPYRPEDCHGMLCAMLVVNNSLQCKRWVDEICTSEQIENQLAPQDQNAFNSLYNHTRQELNDALLNFSLLIPEDESSLGERVSALKKWCDGFLFGLALAGVKDISKLPGDSFEILQDISLILQASDEDEEDELNEMAYTDIVEYIRMGVLLINEELQPMNSPQTIQ